MTDKTSAASGLVVGGLGGDDDQLLEDGQEEVFSRAEVEAGKLEHHAEAGAQSRAPTPAQGVTPCPRPLDPT